MKILLINVVYGIGSTGKIVESLTNEFRNMGHDVLCCYGRHSTIKNDSNIKKCAYEFESKIHHFFSKISGNQYGGMLFSTNKLIKLIRNFKPDVVNLHMLNGYYVNNYKLLEYLKKNNINTVITNHSDIFLTGNCGYALECEKWIKGNCKKCNDVKRFNGPFSLNRTNHFFIKMQKTIAGFGRLKVSNVSPWLTKRSQQSPILNTVKVNTTILNPVGRTFFSHTSTNPYTKYDLNYNKIVFYPTASFANPEKGGQFLFYIAEKLPGVAFFVKSGVPYDNKKTLKNVFFIKEELDQTQIADLYYYANCTIILSKRETFSMVVAESLSEGTPVAGFLSGGPETIAINDYSAFSNYPNIDEFVNNINKLLITDFDKTLISKSASDKYDAAKIAGQYLELYEKNI